MMDLNWQRALIWAAIVGLSKVSSSISSGNRIGPQRSAAIDHRPRQHRLYISSTTNETSYVLRRQQQRRTASSSSYQQYRLYGASEIREKVLHWAEHYPDLIRVTTSQAAFGLPTAGTEDDCLFDDTGDGCYNYIYTIQDYVQHPEGSVSSQALPEVLWSGEVHGDERVGPTAVLEATQIVLDAATCVAHPRPALNPREASSPSFVDAEAWNEELGKAKACRAQLAAQYDMELADLAWLARLVSTRRIVVVPTANALGYARIAREEDGVDPNRDFPYDLTDASQCMQTVAARTINELYQHHLFQLALTFHGGMEVIGFEWGAPSWRGSRSPDDVAQTAIASSYSRFAGGWDDTPPYAYGPMNDLVYPVRGGMEDWAYAGSWDRDRVVQCQPVKNGGYNASRTMYDNATLRVYNMLVETSDRKIPAGSTLGTSENIMKSNAVGNGHVARNIRLAWAAADLVEPYVAIYAVNELMLAADDDIIPLVARNNLSCKDKQRVVMVPSHSRKVTLQWAVGGALSVNDTTLYVGRWADMTTAVLDCQSQPPNVDALLPLLQTGTAISETSGAAGGRFTSDGITTQFSASIDLSAFDDKDELVVLASVRVDQDWKDMPKQFAPTVDGPQSHVAHVRTDPDWYFAKANQYVQGRLDWFSRPLTIVQSANGENGDSVETKEVTQRLADDSGSSSGGGGGSGTSSGGTPGKNHADNSNTSKPRPNDTSGASPRLRLPIFHVLLVGVIVAALVLAVRAYWNYASPLRTARRHQIRAYIQGAGDDDDDDVDDHDGLRGGSNYQNGKARHNGHVRFQDDLDELEFGGQHLGKGYSDDDDKDGDVELERYA